jgi:hypothetical protein
MDWDKLPPRHIDECRYRLVDDSGAAERAVCNLLSQAGIPRALCEVRRDACSACLRQFPPNSSCWNTVVASLIYLGSLRSLQSASLPPEERAHLVQLGDRAAEHLMLSGNDSPPVVPKTDRKSPASSLWTILPPHKPRRRSRVRKWAVGVVSSPRRQPTLEITLDGLIRAGWDRPYLFLDGTVRVPERFADLPGVVREPRVGCWPNHYLALAELLMRHPDADAYLLAEDDALFYDGESLRDYLEQMLWPDRRPCLLSLYCPSVYSARSLGWRPLRRKWAVGSLALIFPRHLAQDFLLDQAVCDHRWQRGQEPCGGLANTDVVIGRWAFRKRVPVWYPTPSLVQHLGVTSTLGLDRQVTGERWADQWIGSFVLPNGNKGP